MARSDGFFAKFGRRRDISTISVRFFDENSIVYFERLLDDRRSLDDTFIVSAMMRDVEKTLKNLDRAHKIEVRRCFADPRSTRHGLQTTSKIHRKIEDKFEGKNDRKTDRKWRPRTLQIRRLGRPGGPLDEQVRAPRRPSRATKRVRSACGASENVLVASNEATSSEKARPVPPRSARASEYPRGNFGIFEWIYIYIYIYIYQRRGMRNRCRQNIPGHA